MNQYDIYHQWLGIAPEKQPPSLYQLLGIADFEQDVDVIRNASERQMTHVRRLARGQFTDVGQALLNEIAEAKLCLLDPFKREAYDRTLLQSKSQETDFVSPERPTGAKSESAEMAKRGQPKSHEASEPCAIDRSTIDEIEVNSVLATYINIEVLPVDPSETRQWIIGYHAQCDFRVDSPTVSGVHCQLTLRKGILYLSDLKSTNGTYINQQRLRSPRAVTRLDLITLGRENRILLPGNLLSSHDVQGRRAMFIGKSRGNEIQIASPTVSSYHARLLFDQKSAILEDLESKNGTYVIRGNEKPLRIRRIRLEPTDVVALGDQKVPANELLEHGKNIQS
ncbi:MAG: FHA domain-containing protein [Pirellulaceae bacterium]